MWHVTSVIVPNKEKVILYGGLGNDRHLRNINDRFGPERASYNICVEGIGYLLLEDVGDKHPPSNYTWAVKVNGIDFWYYEGEGQASITVTSYGTFTISGGGGHVEGKLIPMMSNCNVSMNGPNGFSYNVTSSMIGNNQSINVVPGSPTLIFALAHCTGRGAVPGAGLTIVDPNGNKIDKDNVPNGVVTVNGSGGLIYAKINNPTAGQWTYTVDCQLCECYIYAYAHATSDNVTSAKSAYQQLDPMSVEMLACMNIILPTATTEKLLNSDEMLTDIPFQCPICKASYYALLGALVVLAPEIAIFSILPLETANRVIKIVADILNLDEGTARTVLNGLQTLTDPLDWPAAICKATRQCS